MGFESLFLEQIFIVFKANAEFLAYSLDYRYFLKGVRREEGTEIIQKRAFKTGKKVFGGVLFLFNFFCSGVIRRKDKLFVDI
jgi:hypothetical protein